MRFSLRNFARFLTINLSLSHTKMNKAKLIFSAFLIAASFASCKKCYVCTCTDPSTLYGCTVAGEKIELCDQGLVGKSLLSARVIEKESEGYTCNLK